MNTETQTAKPVKIHGITFGKKGLRDEAGNYYPAHYSKFVKLSDKIECITIYAKKYSTGLPKALNIQNDSDCQSDYFEKDRVRFDAGSLHFKLLNQFIS